MADLPSNKATGAPAPVRHWLCNSRDGDWMQVTRTSISSADHFHCNQSKTPFPTNLKRPLRMFYFSASCTLGNMSDAVITLSQVALSSFGRQRLARTRAAQVNDVLASLCQGNLALLAAADLDDTTSFPWLVQDRQQLRYVLMRLLHRRHSLLYIPQA
jgi:hypothetical protein